MRLRHRILALVSALIGMAWIGASPASAAADAYLGGVDLNTYCVSLGFSGAKLVPPKDVYDWRCYLGDPDNDQGTTWSLSVVDACRYQFAPLVNAGYPVTAATNGHSAGEWKCHATANQVKGYGGMNLTDYCRSIGYDAAKHYGDNVTGWRCVKGSTSAQLNLHAACSYQNRGVVAQGWTVVAVWNGYGDSFKISCTGVHN